MGAKRKGDNRQERDHDLRSEDWRHLRRRISHVRWRGAGDLRASGQNEGAEALPGTDALRAIHA